MSKDILRTPGGGGYRFSYLKLNPADNEQISTSHISSGFAWQSIHCIPDFQVQNDANTHHTAMPRQTSAVATTHRGRREPE